MAIAIDACAAQHQGDRKEQQDRVVILPHARRKGVALAVVADGMGGHTGGALAAEQVVHTAKTNLDQFLGADECPQQMLLNSMQEAHTMIKASLFMNEKDPHSTAVMLLLQPGRVTWGHCGDSRLYHFRGKQLVRRTVDHSYVEHLVATGKITAQQALTHPNRNVLLHRLELAVTDWERLGRSREGLWTTVQLKEAELLEPEALRPRERAFLDASRTAMARGSRLRRALAVVLPLLAVLGYGGMWLKGRVEMERKVEAHAAAAAQQFAAAAQLQSDAEVVRRQAIALFDGNNAKAAESVWGEYRKQMTDLDAALARVAQELETALVLDASRDDVSSLTAKLRQKLR